MRLPWVSECKTILVEKTSVSVALQIIVNDKCNIIVEVTLTVTTLMYNSRSLGQQEETQTDSKQCIHYR